MPISITGKLLCVARQTYQIVQGGPVPPGPNSSAIGWLAPPTGFVSGASGIDAGLVGETASEIIVAFRGTIPPDSPDTGQMLLDWLNDCDAILVRGAGLPGQVHQGFLGALNALWPAMAPAIQAVSTAGPGKPVYVTGHSKGGAGANLCAMWIRSLLPPTVPVIVATFAAAKPGDAVFRVGYDAAITHSVRYEFQDDIVPHLPPGDEFFTMFATVPFLADTLAHLARGYVAVGVLHFINWNKELVLESPLLRFQRFAHLAELMVSLGYPTIIADHRIDVGSGYDAALYP